MREKQFDYSGKNTVAVQGQPILRGTEKSFLYEAFNGFLHTPVALQRTILPSTV